VKDTPADPRGYRRPAQARRWHCSRLPRRPRGSQSIPVGAGSMGCCAAPAPPVGCGRRGSRTPAGSSGPQLCPRVATGLLGPYGAR
jgi:hypothetical protein